MIITAIIVGLAVVLAPWARETRPEWLERPEGAGPLDAGHNGILP